MEKRTYFNKRVGPNKRVAWKKRKYSNKRVSPNKRVGRNNGKNVIKELVRKRELVGKTLLKSSCDFQVQLVIWGTKYSSTKYVGPFKDHLPLTYT